MGIKFFIKIDGLAEFAVETTSIVLQHINDAMKKQRVGVIYAMDATSKLVFLRLHKEGVQCDYGMILLGKAGGNTKLFDDVDDARAWVKAQGGLDLKQLQPDFTWSKISLGN